MTFKQFAKWTNARLKDGYWDHDAALLCSGICLGVYRRPWWRREKYFRENYDVADLDVNVVQKINAIINYDRKVKKGKYE